MAARGALGAGRPGAVRRLDRGGGGRCSPVCCLDRDRPPGARDARQRRAVRFASSVLFSVTFGHRIAVTYPFSVTHSGPGHPRTVIEPFSVEHPVPVSGSIPVFDSSRVTMARA